MINSLTISWPGEISILLQMTPHWTRRFCWSSLFLTGQKQLIVQLDKIEVDSPCNKLFGMSQETANRERSWIVWPVIRITRIVNHQDASISPMESWYLDSNVEPNATRCYSNTHPLQNRVVLLAFFLEKEFLGSYCIGAGPCWICTWRKLGTRPTREVQKCSSSHHQDALFPNMPWIHALSTSAFSAKQMPRCVRRKDVGGRWKGFLATTFTRQGIDSRRERKGLLLHTFKGILQVASWGSQFENRSIVRILFRPCLFISLLEAYSSALSQASTILSIGQELGARI
jgi:hypothetical protein